MSIALIILVISEFLPAKQAILQPLVKILIQPMLSFSGIMDLYLLLNEMVVSKLSGVSPEREGDLHTSKEGVILVALEL